MKVKNIILFLVMLFITMWTPINGASLVVNDVTIKSGQKEQLTINMNNSETNLSGFQFILSLPQGVTIDKNEKNKFIYSLSNRISDHTLSITALNDGRYQFICYSMDGDLITGTSGELLSVTITADNSFTTSGNGTLSDIKLTNINAQKTTCSNVGFHITLQVPASSISLDKPSLTFTAKNQTATLTATVLPSNATDKSVTWTSSNTSVATVDANGKVKAIANGTAIITAKTNDGSNLSATCKVTVDIPIIATNISLDKTSLTFAAKNQTATLTATVLPSNATNKSVTWTSSNTSVATVDANGKVTAVANGTATITAKTNDGSNLSATCTVTVDIPEPGIFNNNKLYTLTCKRGGLVMNAEGTGLAAGQTRTDAPEADKLFAIITYNGQYFLYSPTAKQYLLADGSFVSRLGSAITFDDSKADGEYKFMLSTQGTNGETWYFNNNGNIVINSWDAADDGNRWLIEPVADFDPTEALAMASNQTYMVTYEVLFEGKVVATATEEVASGSALPTVPYPLANSFVILNKIGTHPTTVTKDITAQFAATWNGPFELSKDEATAKWYNMHIHNGWYVGKQNSEPYYPTDNAGDALNTKEYQWAFGGDPYHIKVYNRTTGFAETLSKDGENVVMRSGDYSWDILPNSNGFVLRETGTDYNCINQFGGYGGPLKFWNDGWSPTDDGSTFRVEAVQLLDGDVNNDGKVNGADIVSVINYVLDDNILGDVNGDGRVNGADIVAVINYVLDFNGVREYVHRISSIEENRNKETAEMNATITTEGVNLNLMGGESFTAFQLTLTLPDGVSLNGVEGNILRLGNHELLFHKRKDGKYLVLGYAADNSCIEGDTGQFLMLQISGRMIGTALLTDVLFFTPNAETKQLNDISIDLETGIIDNTIEVSKYNNYNNMFDISGRPVKSTHQYDLRTQNLRRGVYIRNGHKFIVK